MPFIADLHIHSKYSRATSREMTPENIAKWAQLKGISVIGTGDFTHPGWFAELGEKLGPAGNGLFTLKREFMANDVPDSCRGEVFFVLSAEISCIYRKNDRTRKVHCLVFAPDMASAARVNAALSRVGNLTADGRPILGLDAKELLRMVLDASPDAMLVPAHAWTPHFSVFGSASGFDSLEECFDDLTPHIHAIETGLSSDPPMNRRFSALDGITLISNSDAHSPAKIGREANIFDTEVSWGAMAEAIKGENGFAGTIEFFPEEGKYHYDGHRACGVSMHPEETARHGGACPSCKKRLTLGVMHRVETLADREAGTLAGAPPYRSIIPLQEIIAEVLGVGVGSKAVQREYLGLITALGSEFHILLYAPLEEIGATGSPLLKEAVSRVRFGRVEVSPGFDGEYGKVTIFGDDERDALRGQQR